MGSWEAKATISNEDVYLKSGARVVGISVPHDMGVTNRQLVHITRGLGQRGAGAVLKGMAGKQPWGQANVQRRLWKTKIHIACIEGVIESQWRAAWTE